MSAADSSELFRSPGGVAVVVVSLAVFVYALIALGNLLFGTLIVVLLVGGYVVIHVLLRLVRAFERLTTAAETAADAYAAADTAVESVERAAESDDPRER